MRLWFTHLEKNRVFFFLSGRKSLTAIAYGDKILLN